MRALKHWATVGNTHITVLDPMHSWLWWRAITHECRVMLGVEGISRFYHFPWNHGQHGPNHFHFSAAVVPAAEGWPPPTPLVYLLGGADQASVRKCRSWSSLWDCLHRGLLPPYGWPRPCRLPRGDLCEDQSNEPTALHVTLPTTAAWLHRCWLSKWTWIEILTLKKIKERTLEYKQKVKIFYN